MSEIQHMSSGRKAVNLFGSLFFLVIGLLMTIGGQWAGLLLTAFCGYFLYRNFIKPTSSTDPIVSSFKAPDAAPNSAASNDPALGNEHAVSADASVISTASGETESSSKKASSAVWSTFVKVGGVIAIIVVLGLSRVFGAGVAQYFTSTGNGTPSERAQSLLTNKELKEYVSTEHGFRAVFPGFPQIERDSLDLQGYNVPYAMYAASIDENSDTRAVLVWDYTPIIDDASQISLEGALNGMVQNTPGASLISTRVSVLGGVEALEGYYTAPENGQVFDSYARLTNRGVKLYAVWTFGVSKAEFDTFADSFRFE
jgi:hypothetical protein